MISNIVKLWMFLLFGKNSLDGYYASSEEKFSEKKYIFTTVFPNTKLKEIALNDTSSGIIVRREKTKH